MDPSPRPSPRRTGRGRGTADFGFMGSMREGSNAGKKRSACKKNILRDGFCEPIEVTFVATTYWDDHEFRSVVGMRSEDQFFESG